MSLYGSKHEASLPESRAEASQRLSCVAERTGESSANGNGSGRMDFARRPRSWRRKDGKALHKTSASFASFAQGHQDRTDSPTDLKPAKTVSDAKKALTNGE